MNWQKVKNDLLLATSSHFFYKVIGYLVLMILTRYLAKDQMGEFFFAATLASFFVLVTELGMNQYLIREVAGKPQKALQYFSEVISLRLPLLVFYLIVLNGAIFFFKPDLVTIMLLTSVYVLLEEFYRGFGALYLGLKRVTYHVIVTVSTKFLLVGLIFAVVTLKGNLNTILACYILASAILVGFAIYLVWRKIGRFRLAWNSDTSRRILRISLPFFALTVLGLIHFKVDTLMLGFIQSYAAVATYEAGFKLLEVSRFIIRPVVMIFFPLCSEMAVRQNWAEIQALLRKMLLVTGILGAGITLVVLLTAGFIIPIVFGPKYNDSIPVLRVLYLSVPAVYMGMVTTFLANAIHLEKKVVGIMLIGVMVNLGLNSIAIPVWGVLGAAWTTVISETILTVWLIKLNWEELRRLLSREAWPAPRLEPILSTKE